MEIDKLIDTAQTAVNQSTEADKPANEAYLKALQDAKERSIGFSQEELNSVGKQEREKAASDANKAWSDTLGMELEEAQSILGDMSDEELANLLPDANAEENGEGEGEGETMSERSKAALSERDQKINASDERITNLSQSLYSERVENGLKNALRDKGLKEGRFDLARKLSGESDLVKTLMDGKELEADAFSKAADSLYEASPEWFSDGSEPSGDDGSKVINGIRVREEASPSAGIPPTPSGNDSSQLTDAQRAERSTSIY